MKLCIGPNLAAALSLALLAAPWAAADEQVQANTWVTVDDAAGGGCAAGLVYLPELKGMLLFGRRDGRGAEGRLRWLRVGDGWVKTVMGSKPGKWDLDGMGKPADNVKMSWCWALAVDRQGRAYVMNGASKTGCWRLYRREDTAR
jgi:hypothetical protein